MNALLTRARRSAADKRGFTLVELLVTVGLTVLVLAVVYTLFSFSQGVTQRTDDKAARQSQARLMLYGLKKDIGTAQEISLPAETQPDAVTPAEDCHLLYVKGGLLCRKDADGTVTQVYSTVALDTLSVRYTVAGTNLLRVAILFDGEELSSTEIYCQNAVLAASPTEGELLVYKQIY